MRDIEPYRALLGLTAPWTVAHLADDRKQASLDGFWPTLTPAQREGITAVAMDMWGPYMQSTRAHLPAADASKW